MKIGRMRQLVSLRDENSTKNSQLCREHLIGSISNDKRVIYTLRILSLYNRTLRLYSRYKRKEYTLFQTTWSIWYIYQFEFLRMFLEIKQGIFIKFLCSNAVCVDWEYLVIYLTIAMCIKILLGIQYYKKYLCWAIK